MLFVHANNVLETGYQSEFDGEPKATKKKATKKKATKKKATKKNEIVTYPKNDNLTTNFASFQIGSTCQMPAAGGIFDQHIEIGHILYILSEYWNKWPNNPTSKNPGGYFPHIIYAYLIENTRIYEIFQRVISEFRNGEKLNTPSEEGQRWLDLAEELFFTQPQRPFFPITITSNIRDDARAIRRNAYYRMFGMDLTHGTDDNKAYPYVKSKVANKDFAETLEKLLREVWVGYSYRNATSTSSPVDPNSIAELLQKLKDMLTSRRLGNNLTREEFYSVSAMSFFHLTVNYDSPILLDLRAEATSPAERLKKISEKVGLPFNSRSDGYFDLAEPLAQLLHVIEHDPLPAPHDLYEDGRPYQAIMLEIINSWSIVTGRNMKTRPTELVNK